MECSLCNPQLGPIIAEGTHWRLVLNHNQNLLGKCFLATRRHIEEVRNLTPEEWSELHTWLADTSNALVLAFQPDHFNYAFLQNLDRHVHLHIIPRYAGSRTFEDTTFTDPAYPDHYPVDAPPQRLQPGTESLLADHLRHLIHQVQANTDGLA